MGMDIHFSVEKRINNKWEYSEDAHWVNCRSCTDDGSEECFFCKSREFPGKEDALTFEDRNRALFGILANMDRGSFIEPISEPKGLPDDASKEVVESYGQFGDFGDYAWGANCEYFGHSYLSLKELKEYDWEKKFVGGRRDGDPAKEVAGFFYRETIPALQKIADECGGDENVRIVFCFDN